MDFFNSRDKRHGKRAGLLGHKSASKSNPSSPPHPTEGRSPPVSYFGMKRSESEYAFPISDDQTTHWKQQRGSERVPNSHHRPPVYRYSTPERPRENGKERTEAMNYEPDADVTPRSNASGSPFRSTRTRTPDRRRRSSEFSKELYERMYDAEANVSPFHPSRSRSPAPYNKHNRDRDYSRERYEAEGNVTSRNSAPSSPFHPARSRSLHTMPQRYNEKDLFDGMYEADADVTPRNSPPMSPVDRATSRSPPPPFYSSSDDDEDDNHSAYLFPEIANGRRSRAVSASSTPVHQKYQITTTETYEQDKQFEPPELPDESESFTLQEIVKMRGYQSYDTGKEEIESAINETYVSVANYKVRMRVSATLKAILEKHGDIAASSKLQSNSTRSFYLESLAVAVMELKSTALRDLTKTRVAEIAAVVKDMDSVKIDVSWLKTAVTELAEAVEYFGQYDTAKIEREECNRDMTAGKAEMEELWEELRRREKETKDCRERVTAMAGRLGQLEIKDTRVEKNLELFQSKVHKFDGQAVLLDL